MCEASCGLLEGLAVLEVIPTFSFWTMKGIPGVSDVGTVGVQLFWVRTVFL
jgi:hypothetical protein